MTDCSGGLRAGPLWRSLQLGWFGGACSYMATYLFFCLRKLYLSHSYIYFLFRCMRVWKCIYFCVSRCMACGNLVILILEMDAPVCMQTVYFMNLLLLSSPLPVSVEFYLSLLVSPCLMIYTGWTELSCGVQTEGIRAPNLRIPIESRT